MHSREMDFGSGGREFTHLNIAIEPRPMMLARVPLGTLRKSRSRK